MEMMVDLLAGRTTITSIPFPHCSFKAVQGLSKLESHPFLSNAFVTQKDVAVDYLIILNRPLKEFNRLGMTQDIFK
jgi:hypothetical protein